MDSDTLAKSVLEGLGFNVRKLPEPNIQGKQRADFLATLDGLSVLVEAKVRKDDPKELQRMESELAQNGSYASDHEVGLNNILSGKVRDASRQLDAEQEESHEYKVLMYLADCINPEVVTDQIADTLYGSTTVLLSLQGVPGYQEKRCYFYSESEFYRCKTLNAAIIGFQAGDRWELFLCVNPYAERFGELRTSALTRLFSCRVIDPVAEEARGQALLPGDDAPRPTTKQARVMERSFSLLDGMLRHLEVKYGYAPNSLAQGPFKRPLVIARSPS